MARKISSAAQMQIWSNALSFADYLLFNTRRIAPVLLAAAAESDRIGKSITTKSGAYRALSEAECAHNESALTEFKHRVQWDLWEFVSGIVLFERMCKPVLPSVAALYPVHAQSVRVWDIRAMTGMEAVGRVAENVFVGTFGAHREVLELVKTGAADSTQLQEELQRRVFPYWPGHFYRTWLGRTSDDLLELEVTLRREHVHLIGRDPGPSKPEIGDDGELPEVSRKGTPEQPTHPMSIAHRADSFGIDSRTFRSAMIRGQYRYQKQSARLYCFCDAEPRPPKRTRATAKPSQAPRRP